MEQVKIGIIGGSGLYQMPELKNVREQKVETPFGKPSDVFIIGELEDVTVAFLPRHGRGHTLLPPAIWQLRSTGQWLLRPPEIVSQNLGVFS